MIYSALLSCFISIVIKAQPIPDELFIIPFLSDPESLTCAANETTTCDAIGFVCNTDTNLCAPGCSTVADCASFGEGTGLNVCNNGFCSTDGTCTSDTECASQIGFYCDTSTGQCAQPTGCLKDSECTTPGVGKCDNSATGTGICVVENCETSADCITTGYVCQAQVNLCIESCATNDICESPITCNTDTGLCELTGCTTDADCTGRTNTCLEGTCITTCTTTQDCKDLGIPATTCQSQGDQMTCLPDTTPPGDCQKDADCGNALAPICDDQFGICMAGCDTDQDCEDNYGLVDATCEEDSTIGRKTCATDAIGTGTCSTDGDCQTGYKCNSVTKQCYPECDNDADCVDLGLESPCKSQKFNTGVPGVSITIKYCDVTQTLSPTSSPTMKADQEDNVGYYRIFEAITVIMVLMSWM